MRSYLSLLCACLLNAAAWAESTPASFFEPPVALADAGGTALITGKAQGCPTAADFNGDGKLDLILGAKDGMDTAMGGIWLIPNAGSKDKPAFRWTDAHRVALGDAAVSVACGCKSSGQVQPVACDWNDDGFLDIAYSDTYRRAYLLINDGKNKDKPTFTQQTFFDMEKTNHGMYAGGGDWDGDGVVDFLHMAFAGSEFKLFKGARQAKGGVKFVDGGLKACQALSIGGQKPRRCAWAWDYSGTAKQRGAIEYVGIVDLPSEQSEIGFYEVVSGQSKKLCVLVTPEGKTPLLTAVDLNADGKMDLLYSCGLWNNEKDKTKVWVMYGKK